VTPLEFCRLFGVRVPVLSYSVVCVILFSRFCKAPACDERTDGQTDRQTAGRTYDDSTYRASIASCGKKKTRIEHLSLTLNSLGKCSLLTPGRGCEVSQSACLYVCLSVCPLEYLKNISTFHHFCTCYPWTWFGPLLTAEQ